MSDCFARTGEILLMNCHTTMGWFFNVQRLKYPRNKAKKLLLLVQVIFIFYQIPVLVKSVAVF